MKTTIMFLFSKIQDSDLNRETDEPYQLVVMTTRSKVIIVHERCRDTNKLIDANGFLPVQPRFDQW